MPIPVGADDMQGGGSPNAPSPSSGASPSTLAGADADPSAGGQPAPSQGAEGLKQAVQTVRQIQVQLMDIARQFPSAAASIRESANKLRAALKDIITNPGAPEPPSPNVGG